MKPKIEEMLPVKLTADELKDRQDQMLEQMTEVDLVEAEKKDAMADFRGRLKDLHGEIATKASSLRTGTEKRMVACEERVAADGKLVEVFRLDTGEIVRTRPAADADKQGKLPLDIGPDEDFGDPKPKGASGKSAKPGWESPKDPTPPATPPRRRRPKDDLGNETGAAN